MKINIKYNDELDEFTSDLSLQMRLRKYINKHFDIAYAIAYLAPTYLVGGGIRDLINATKPKDLDFVVLGKENYDWIIDILNTFKIDYKLNKFGGYKFTYNDTEIDLWITEDLFSSMQYNIDGLYFNLNTNSLLSLTFNDFYNNGLKLINKENNIENGRVKKLIKFETEFINKNKV